MRIVLLCATLRGLGFLRRLAELAPHAEFVVCSFREEPLEPPFLDQIRQFTESIGGTFHETKNVGSPQLMNFWKNTPFDLMFAVSWRYMVPREMFGRARLGAFVFHDSLLPKYRGFAPTVWAIVNGEDRTGVTLFEMSDAVDDGGIIGQETVPIGRDDTIPVVMDAVTQAYLSLLERKLPELIQGTAKKSAQDPAQATYTCKRLPEDNLIHWERTTTEIFDLIRGVTRPYSGAFTTLNGKKLTVWSAHRLVRPFSYVGRVPGRVVEIRPGEGTVILTGNGSLLLQRVQVENANEACAADVINRLSMTLGRQ